MNAFSRNFGFLCCFSWSILSVFVLESTCSKWRESTTPSNAPLCHHPTPHEAWNHPSNNCWWATSKENENPALLLTISPYRKKQILNGWVAWRIRTRIVLLSSHRQKTISARDLNGNLSIVMLIHTGKKSMYQFRLPNVTESVVLCIPVEKLVMTFLGRLQVTNAHFKLKRKGSSHQFSVLGYIMNTGEALL